MKVKPLTFMELICAESTSPTFPISYLTLNNDTHDIRGSQMIYSILK